MLLDEHADVIREAVRAVAAELMELEVSEPALAVRTRVHARGHRPARWRRALRERAAHVAALQDLNQR